jgi:hypothetical protein
MDDACFSICNVMDAVNYWGLRILQLSSLCDSIRTLLLFNAVEILVCSL